MFRSTIKRPVIATVTLLVGGGLLAACGGGGAELRIVRSFFQASNYGDPETLTSITMVAFDAREDGMVSSPSVDGVTEERRHALRLQDLSAALEATQASEDEFRAEKNAYQAENFEAVTRVVEAERADGDVADDDREVQEAWTTYRETERAFARTVSNAQNELNDESRVAAASVYDRGNPIDVAQYEGELISKDVTVTATIEKDGLSSERTMVITLQKAKLQAPDGLIEGRWIIVALE